MASLIAKQTKTPVAPTKSELKATTTVKAPVNTEAETDDTDKILVQNQHARALKIGGQINEATDTEVRAIIEAGTKLKSGPLWHMFNLIDQFNGEMSEWPVPRSDKGNNPDKMTVKAKDATTGESKSVTSYFYADVYDASPDGLRVNQALVDLDAAMKAVAKSDRPAQYRDWAQTDFAPERKSIANERTQGIALYRKAVDCYLQIQAIEEMSDEVKMDIAKMKDAGGTFVKTKGRYPVKIWSVRAPDDDRKSLSVSQFLNLDPRAAMENGGTFDALMETAKKGADDEDGDTEAEPWSLDVAESNAAMFAHFLEDEANKIELFKRLNSKDPAKSNDFLTTLGNIYTELGSFLSPKKPLGRRYYALVEMVPGDDDESEAA